MDILTAVRQKLAQNKGNLPSIARETGMSYDSVLRIMHARVDPGYSKVRRLAEYFGLQDREAA